MATENQEKAGIFVGALGAGILIGWLIHGQKAQAAGLPFDVIISNVRSSISPVPYQQPVDIQWDITNNGTEVFNGLLMVQVGYDQSMVQATVQPGQTQTLSVPYTRTDTLTSTVNVEITVIGAQAMLATIPVG